MKTLLALSIALGLACSTVAIAQQRTATPEFRGAVTAQGKSEPIMVTLHATAAAKPALKYSLLPDLLDQTSGDAVPLYYTTLLLAPKAGDEVEKINAMLKVPLAEFNPTEADKLITARTALTQLALAARCDRCNWDLPFRKQGGNVRLPGLSDFRRLANQLCLQIRIETATKQYDQAVSDFQTGYALARDLCRGGTIIQGLFGIIIASQLNAQLLDFIQQPDAPNLYWALSVLPSNLVSLDTGLRNERDLLFFNVPQLAQFQKTGHISQEDFDSLLADLQGPVSGQPASPDRKLETVAIATLAFPEAKRYLIAGGMPAADIERMPVREVLTAYFLKSYQEVADEAFKWLLLPYPEGQVGFRNADRKTRDRAQALNPLLKALPAFGERTSQVAECSRQLAAARIFEALRIYAAAHNHQLPPTLEAITDLPIPMDPVTDHPFEYTFAGNRATLIGYGITIAP